MILIQLIEQMEYQKIRKNLSKNAIVLGDNSHVTDNY